MAVIGRLLVLILFSIPSHLTLISEPQKSLEQSRGNSLETQSNFPKSLRYLIITTYKNNAIANTNQSDNSKIYPNINDFLGKVIIEKDPKLTGLPLKNSDGLAKINEPPINFRYPPLNRNSQTTTTTISSKSTQSLLSTPAINSTEQENQDIRLYETIFKAFSYIFLGAIIISNLMVLIAYAKYHRLHTITNRFVISLAVADLCVGLSRSIQEIVEYLDPSDPAREIVTYRVQFFGTFPTTMNVASLLSLLGVTIDRFISVINPLRYTAIMTEKLANGIIIGAWCLAAVIIYIVPHFFIFWHGRRISHYYLLYRYILITYFILFVSLLFIISLFYARIFYACNKHQLMALFSKDFSARASSQSIPVPSHTNVLAAHREENNSNKSNASQQPLPVRTTDNNALLGTGANNGSINDSTNDVKKSANTPSLGKPDLGIAGAEGMRNSLTVSKKADTGSLGSEPLQTCSPPLIPHGILKTTSSSLNNVHHVSPKITHRETSLSTDACPNGNPALEPQRTVSISDDKDEIIIPLLPSFHGDLATSQSNTSKDLDDPSQMQRHSNETAPLTRRESAGVIIASKATIMIAMIVGTFATLGLPLQIMEYALIFKYDSIQNKVRFFIIHGICVLLYYSNSAVNPYIYAWKNRDFREAFKRILTCNRHLNFFRDRAPTNSYFDDLPPLSTRKSRLASFFSSFDKNNHARGGSKKAPGPSREGAATKRGDFGEQVWKSRHS